MGALEIWNKSDRMNLSNVIFLAIQSSTYFKELYRLKTYHEVIQEIRTEVMSVDPWIKGTKTPSTCMCLLFKLFTLRLTMKQLRNMLDKDPSQTVRAMAVLYLRLCCKPQSMWEWFQPLIHDDSELTLVPDKPAVPFGLFVIRMIKEQHFFDVLLPRIPVPIHRKMLDCEELKDAEALHVQTFSQRFGGSTQASGASGRSDDGDRRGDLRRGGSRERGGRGGSREIYRDRRGGRPGDGYRDRHDDRGRRYSDRRNDYGRRRDRHDDRDGRYSPGRHRRYGRDRRSPDRRRYDRDEYDNREEVGGRKRRRDSRSSSPSKRRRVRSKSPQRKPEEDKPSAPESTGSASETFRKLQLLYGSGSSGARQESRPSAPLSAREEQERARREAAALDLKHTGEDVVRLGY